MSVPIRSRDVIVEFQKQASYLLSSVAQCCYWGMVGPGLGGKGEVGGGGTPPIAIAIEMCRARLWTVSHCVTKF
jgi:hypothetical protein